MPEPKWTKGPLKHDDEGFVFRDDATGTTIALPGDATTPEERKANACLWAHALNLHEVVEAFYLAAKMDGDLHPAWRVIYDAAADALRKSGGE